MGGRNRVCWRFLPMTRASPGPSANLCDSLAKSYTGRARPNVRSRMADWTPTMVEDRLESAADVFRKRDADPLLPLVI